MAFGVRALPPAGPVTARSRRGTGPAPGHGVRQALGGLWNLASLNLLFLVGCAGVVTIPLSIYAAFGAVDRWLRLGDERVARNFVEIARTRSGRALLACGAPLCVGAAGVLEVAFFARRAGVVDRCCLGLGLGFAASVLCCYGYVLLLTAGQDELPVAEVWRLAGRLGLRNLVVTGPLFFLEAAGAAALGLVEPGLAAVLLPVVLLVLVHRTALFGLRRATGRGSGGSPSTRA